MRLTSRTLQLAPSPIADAYAWLAHRTSDRHLLDLSQAAPSYPTAPEIAERIAEIAHTPDGGRYAPPRGLPALTEAFAAEMSRDYGATIEPAQIQPTGGCNQAFCCMTSALTQPGDEVILPIPYYFNHDMWLKLDGVRPAYLYPRGWSDGTVTAADLIPDPARAAELITNRTRAIVLVTPANPTGAITPPEVIRAFYDLAVRHDLALILDETYRNFRGTTAPAHDLFTLPRWWDHVISLHSFSKDLAIPGYRAGAVVASRDVLEEALKMIDCVQISAPRISQEAVLCGLRQAAQWRRGNSVRVAEAQVVFEEVMAGRPGGFELVSTGAFFGWVRHPFADLATGEVIKHLVLDHDVLAIPGTGFTPTDDRWIRFSFANLPPDDLRELGRRLDEMAAAHTA